MKKVALSLIALLAAGTFAFAEDVAAEKAVKSPVEVTLAAEGKAKFGFDLDTGVHGFANSFEADLAVVIVPEADSTKSGTGDVYGTITIEDVSVKIAGDKGDESTDDAKWINVGDVTAKLVFPNGYIKLFGVTNPAVDYSLDGDDEGEALVLDDTFYTYNGIYGGDGAPAGYVNDEGDAEWQFNDIRSFDGFASVGGIAIGYTLPSLVEFTLGVGSETTWERTNNANGDDSDYEASLEASLLAVEKLTFKVKGFMTSAGEDKKTAAGLTVAYDLGVVAPFAHLNAIADTPDTEDGFWAADFGSRLPLVDGFDAVVAAKYDSAANIDAIATFSVAKDKLVGPASAAFGVWLRDLTSSVDADKKTDIFAKVAFDLGGGVGIWGKTSYNMTGADDSSSLFLKAGIDAAVFPLTTIGAEWDSNDFGAAETIKNADGDVTPLGQFYVYAKVAY